MTREIEFNHLNNHKKICISQEWRGPRQGREAVAAPLRLLTIGQLLSPARGWVTQSQLGWLFSCSMMVLRSRARPSSMRVDRESPLAHISASVRLSTG